MIARLFLGLPIDSPFEIVFSQLDPAFAAHYVGADEMFLQIMSHDGDKYIGKWASETNTIESLEQLQANIISVLKKLVHDYPYEDVTLQLFPVLV